MPRESTAAGENKMLAVLIVYDGNHALAYKAGKPDECEDIAHLSLACELC